MTWGLQLPYRDRSEPFNPVRVAELAAEAISDPEERRVVNALALDIHGRVPTGSTFGSVLDTLRAADPAARRELLNHARESAGLRTIEREEQFEAFEQANANPARSSTVEARCSEPGCENAELDHQMFARRVNVRRWWCPDHRAGHEEEMIPRPRQVFNPRTGSIIELDERELEREKGQARAESRRQRRETAEAARRAESEQAEHSKRQRDEATARELPIGLRPAA